MKNPINPIGNQTRGLPACGAVSQTMWVLTFPEGIFIVPMTFIFASNLAMDCQMPSYVA